MGKAGRGATGGVELRHRRAASAGLGEGGELGGRGLLLSALAMAWRLGFRFIEKKERREKTRGVADR